MTVNKKELKRPDRVGCYLKKHMELFVFDELSPAHLESEGLEGIMKDVVIPFRREDLEAFRDGDGLKITDMVENMVSILGMDPEFVYLQEYKAYMEHYFKENVVEGIVSLAMRAAQEGQLEYGAIQFRGALAIAPDHIDALYGYARVCRQIYQEAIQELESSDPQTRDEYVARFKAESTESFERLTLLAPDFAPPYYFTGYAYLNMGLYRKAQLTWKEYMKYSDEEDSKEEVQARLDQLLDPVEIEEGCNDVMSGRWEQGIRRLEPYISTDYQEWWPMHYYLGIAYSNAGRLMEAEEALKKALQIEPSQTDCMEELADLYKELGETLKEEKYRKKIEVIKNMIDEI